jgi:putative SOS response-associated peptidase YedK
MAHLARHPRQQNQGRRGEHLLFSFLTTEPNDEVKPIHPKAMPVLLLDQAARETWLRGSVEQALALQRPAAEGALRIMARGEKQDAPLAL